MAIHDFALDEKGWRHRQLVIAILRVVVEGEIVVGHAQQRFNTLAVITQRKAGADQRFHAGVNGIFHVQGQAGARCRRVIHGQNFIFELGIVNRYFPVPFAGLPQRGRTAGTDFPDHALHGIQGFIAGIRIVFQFVQGRRFIKLADIGKQLTAVRNLINHPHTRVDGFIVIFGIAFRA